jgi:uncharacterized protein YndB with AHSA1/START domain
MPVNQYQFVTVWEVESTPDEVFDILDDPADLVRWWPSVYLDVVVEEPGDEQGVGKVVSLLTKGWLPYKLRWTFRVTEKVRPSRIALDAWGDLDGHAEWSISPPGPQVRARYDWRVRADETLLRHLTFLFEPVFSANHRWAMARGEESLKAELDRRRAESGRVPGIRRPGPTFTGAGPAVGSTRAASPGPLPP